MSKWTEKERICGRGKNKEEGPEVGKSEDSTTKARHRFHCQDMQGDDYFCNWSCHISRRLLDWDESPPCSHSCRSPGYWCRQNLGHRVMDPGGIRQYLQRTQEYQTTQRSKEILLSRDVQQTLCSPMQSTFWSMELSCPLLGAKPRWQVQK